MKNLKEYIVTENNFFKNLGIGMRPDVEKWVKERHIKNYTINDDLTIDVKGDIYLLGYKEEQLPEYIQFGRVDGWFNISRCPNLTTLEGCPQEVSGFFDCNNCPKLKSLKGAPQEVGGDFECYKCKNLTSLEGCPQEVGGNFECMGCEKLESLKGCPQEVGKSFSCSGCNIKSLDGCPQYVGGDFYCHECNKKITQKDVQNKCTVKGDIIV